VIEVEATGIAGAWRVCGGAHIQFRTDEGGVLNWWSTTGKVYFQGQSAAAQRLKQALLHAAVDDGLRDVAEQSMLRDRITVTAAAICGERRQRKPLLTQGTARDETIRRIRDR